MYFLVGGVCFTIGGAIGVLLMALIIGGSKMRVVRSEREPIAYSDVCIGEIFRLPKGSELYMKTEKGYVNLNDGSLLNVVGNGEFITYPIKGSFVEGYVEE